MQHHVACLLILLTANRAEHFHRVDLIELNHLHDEFSKPVIHQIIFWEWVPEFRRFDVVAWRLTEDDPQSFPFRLPNGDWQAQWFDKDAKAYRQVRSHLFRETWTISDPERANKRLCDEKSRSGLWRLKHAR